MIQKASWLIFRRMQTSLLAVGGLVYLAAGVDAWGRLPLGETGKWSMIAGFPGLYLVIVLGGALAVPAIRRALRRHLVISYRAGFGQSAISVLVGLGLLVAIAGLIVWQVHGLAHGGPSPSGAFAGYGAGLGLLGAQVIHARALENDPAIRDEIEAAG